jgi:hypothetical protein
MSLHSKKLWRSQRHCCLLAGLFVLEKTCKFFLYNDIERFWLLLRCVDCVP